MNIELQKLTERNIDFIIPIYNSVDRRYLSDRLPYPYTKKCAMSYLDMTKERDEKNAIYRVIIVDDIVRGTISIEQKEDVYRGDADIGYLLSSDVKSKGVMTEAVRQACEMAFDKLDIIRITGNVFEPNIASIRVLEKNDFVREGKKISSVIKNGIVMNLHIYGKIKNDRF